MNSADKNSSTNVTDSSNDDSEINLSSLWFLRALTPVVILLLGFGVYKLLITNLPEEEDKQIGIIKQSRELKTRVIELNKENYQTKIQANGIVKAHNEISLTSQVSGRIITIHPQFDDGAFFEKGTVLLELEEADFLTAVASATANLAQAEAAHAQEKARSEQARLNWEDLGYDEEPNELVLRLPQLREAVARVNSAKTQLAQAERNLGRSKIRAPFDGRVIQRNVGISQAISATTILGKIFSVDYAEVRLPISSQDMKHLKLPEAPDDEPLEIKLSDALNEENESNWPAQIVRTEGTLDQSSLELFAIARIPDPFGKESGNPPLRIGQPVEAEIPGNVIEDVFKIPRMAVRQLRMIYLVDKESSIIRGSVIKTINESEEFIFIKDPDITEGTLLATTPMAWVPEGAKVEIINDKEEQLLESEETDSSDNKTSSF